MDAIFGPFSIIPGDSWKKADEAVREILSEL